MIFFWQEMPWQMERMGDSGIIFLKIPMEISGKQYVGETFNCQW